MGFESGRRRMVGADGSTELSMTTLIRFIIIKMRKEAYFYFRILIAKRMLEENDGLDWIAKYGK